MKASILVLLVALSIGAIAGEPPVSWTTRFASADRLVITRGSRCHPERTPSYVIATVVGRNDVASVLRHLAIEPARLEPVEGEDFALGEVTLICCPDYTITILEDEKEIGFLGVVSTSIVKNHGIAGRGDVILTPDSVTYLEVTFGLSKDPESLDEKRANQALQTTPVTRSEI